MIACRSILTGLVALVAAPTIVRAGSLMPVNVELQPTPFILQPWQRQLLINLSRYRGVSYGSVDVLYGVSQIDRAFMDEGQWTKAELERFSGHQYDNMFAADGAKIGDVVRIRLPDDFSVSDRPKLQYNKVRRSIDVVLQVPDDLALAAAAVAVAPVVLAKPVTRRFWAK